MKLIVLAGCVAILAACGGAADVSDEPGAPAVDTSLGAQKKPMMLDIAWETETYEFSKTGGKVNTTKK